MNLRIIVAQAIWEDRRFHVRAFSAKWDRLAPDEQEYWARIADVAINQIRTTVMQPEWDRWQESTDECAVYAIGAIGNVVAHLVTGRRAETVPTK